MNTIVALQVRASARLGSEGSKEAEVTFSAICDSIEARALAEYGEETRRARAQHDCDTARAYFLSAIADGGTIKQAAQVARESIGL